MLSPVQDEQVYEPESESSVTIRIIRGERIIEVSETLIGDDLASENETKAAIARLSAAVETIL